MTTMTMTTTTMLKSLRAALTACALLVAAAAAHAVPTVTLTAPAANGTYLAPVTSITVSATASAPAPDTIVRVEFYANGNLIGTDTTAGYSIAWTAVPAGSYSLTAKAIDSAGGETTSAPRTITVNASNTAPTAVLSAPANNAKYIAPANITVSASASGPELNDPVARVEFYANGALIGTDTTSPYSFSWAAVPAGTYTLTAKAVDGQGAETVSAARTVVVSDTNPPPTVALTAPAANTTYKLPATITLSATASAGEVNDSLAKVEFFANGTLIGTDTTSPYSITWSPGAAGSYSLTAKATDAAGQEATSAARSVTVAANAPPTAAISAPAANAKYAAPASFTFSATATAPEANDTVARVEFYANGNLLGTDTTSPYSIAVTGLAAGTYSLTVKAIDADGAETTSAPRTITVGANTPPTVSLTTPTAGTYKTPANLTVTATAAAGEVNDTITKVEFFANGALIGTDTTSPYSIAWTPAAGTYSLTAKATDNLGGETTSAPRAFTIAANAPPTGAISTPAANAKYAAPASFTFSATAAAPELNDAVARVEFYANGNLLGTDTTSPYSINVADLAAGSYVLTVKAIDGEGAETTSAARTITVAANSAPTVSLTTPTAGTYKTPANLTVTATAAAGEVNDSITKVEFFANGVLIGTDTTSPYSVAWSPAAGTYSVTAKATDNLGGETTSAPRAFTIAANAPPTAAISTPAANAKYAAPASFTFSATAAAPELNDAVARVEFYANGNLLGTDTTSPYSITVTDLAAGTYVLTVKAIDGEGAETISAARTITVAANSAPTVSLTTPTAGTYKTPANLTVTATAAAGEVNDSITKVEFFANGVLIGTDTTSPYSVAWSPAAGTYSVTAKATDNLGGETTSAPRAVTVAANAPPIATISAPAANAKFNSPAAFTFSATATAPELNDSLQRVEFYANGQLLGTDTTSPYSINVTGLAAGTYSLTAKAIDADNAETVSAARTIVVSDTNTPPTVSLTAPAANATYNAPASITVSANASAVETNGTITKVEFFANGTLIGTDTTSPYSIAWDNVPAGTYSLTAKATDNLNAETTSTARTITVNGPPTIAITSPTSGASFIAPASVTIQATAADPGGSLQRVEFYNGATLLGTDTAAPYEYVWANVPVGSYTLTAKAVDNQNNVTTSAAVSITVANAINLYYIHPDHLNSPRAITDNVGRTVWKWDNQDPFGNNPPDEDPDADARLFSFNLRFPGQYFDAETNLSYNYFRDYDPATGRYVQADPVGLIGGFNLFAYAEDSPIDSFDVWGLKRYRSTPGATPAEMARTYNEAIARQRREEYPRERDVQPQREPREEQNREHRENTAEQSAEYFEKKRQKALKNLIFRRPPEGCKWMCTAPPAICPTPAPTASDCGIVCGTAVSPSR